MNFMSSNNGLQPCVFLKLQEISEITSAVSAPLLQKQALVDFLQYCYSKQLFGNLLGSPTRILLKDSLINIL